MMRVAFVTSRTVDGALDDLDRPFVDRAFTAAGIELVHLAWEDDAVDWFAHDLVVVRTPWNYVEEEPTFRRFLDRFRGAATFWNPVELLEWNIDKHYLVDLAAHGVPVVPTRYVDGSAAIDDALGAFDAPELVVKPTVSAGSRLTGRFASDDPRAAALIGAILDDGRVAMVQPCLPAIDDEGEYAVIEIDGVVAHRARKAQILDVGGTFVGGEYRELITPADADPVLDRVSLLAADACRAIARQRGWLGVDDELLYARYDVARSPDGGAVLIEAELFEPALFMPAGPATADALAAACARRIDQLRS